MTSRSLVASVVSDEEVKELAETPDKRPSGSGRVTIAQAGEKDVYRLGLGDSEGLQALQDDLVSTGTRLLHQSGLRMRCPLTD